MTRSIGLVRVGFVVGESGALVSLAQPPNGNHQRRTARLAARLKPQVGTTNAFSCILAGSVHEASRQMRENVLWVRLNYSDHIFAVHCSELLDASAGLSSRYEKTVSLQEKSGATSKIDVTISLQIADSLRESEVAGLHGVFILFLEAEPEHRNACAERRIRLRVDGVESTLDSDGRFEHPLSLADSWDTASDVIADLAIFVQAAEDCQEIQRAQLDMSSLCDVARRWGCRDRSVSAEVESCPNNLDSVVLRFRARLECIPLKNTTPGTADAVHDIVQQTATTAGTRIWKFSIETRSLRLTDPAAGVHAMYNYGLFQQALPFRTRPIGMTQCNVWTDLPHTFASYTLAAAEDVLCARLSEGLRLEIKHRLSTVNEDAVLGRAEVHLAPILAEQADNPSVSYPTFQHCRMLDQTCPLLSVGENPRKVGSVRILAFVEDMGPVTIVPAVTSGKPPLVEELCERLAKIASMPHRASPNQTLSDIRGRSSGRSSASAGPSSEALSLRHLLAEDLMRLAKELADERNASEDSPLGDEASIPTKPFIVTTTVLPLATAPTLNLTASKNGCFPSPPMSWRSGSLSPRPDRLPGSANSVPDIKRFWSAPVKCDGPSVCPPTVTATPVLTPFSSPLPTLRDTMQLPVNRSPVTTPRNVTGRVRPPLPSPRSMCQPGSHDVSVPQMHVQSMHVPIKPACVVYTPRTAFPPPMIVSAEVLNAGLQSPRVGNLSPMRPSHDLQRIPSPARKHRRSTPEVQARSAHRRSASEVQARSAHRQISGPDRPQSPLPPNMEGFSAPLSASPPPRTPGLWRHPTEDASRSAQVAGVCVQVLPEGIRSGDLCVLNDSGRRRWRSLNEGPVLTKDQRGEKVRDQELSDVCMRNQHKLGHMRENITCVTSL